PKYLEWNVEIQQSIGQKTAVSLNYVGNRGSDLFVFNPFVNAYAGAFGTFTGLPPTCDSTSPVPPCGPADLRVNNVNELTNNARSNYHGVTVSLRQRVTKGLSGSINYTWSHALDDVSNGGISPFSLNDSLQYQFNPAGLQLNNYSNGDYDVRHNLSAS